VQHGLVPQVDAIKIANGKSQRAYGGSRGSQVDAHEQTLKKGNFTANSASSASLMEVAAAPKGADSRIFMVILSNIVFCLKNFWF
jgi:hypothetical protein